MSGLQNLGLLEELNLRRNRIRSLAGLEAVPSLQKLYMSNNEIQGLGSLGQLHHLARLQTLQMEADMQPVFDICLIVREYSTRRRPPSSCRKHMFIMKTDEQAVSN